MRSPVQSKLRVGARPHTEPHCSPLLSTLKTRSLQCSRSKFSKTTCETSQWLIVLPKLLQKSAARQPTLLIKRPRHWPRKYCRASTLSSSPALEFRHLQVKSRLEEVKSIYSAFFTGIPDFRGPDGNWTLRAQGRPRTKHANTLQAIPTLSHMALVELQNRGILRYLISQNCDGLHRRSGILPVCWIPLCPLMSADAL